MDFFEGRYQGKAIQVDSSRTGKAEEEMIARLLKVEQPDEPTEIVIHVNMLKEGWDVTNLYTIVPLRAANARILIEQSIGRGLRLPFGKRTGVTAVDRLNIVAHDKFQDIIDEANRPDSAIRLQAVVLDEADLDRKTATLVSRPKLEEKLGITPLQLTPNTHVTGKDEPPIFEKPEERKVAQITWEEIRKLTHQPQKLPSVIHLQKPEIQAALVEAVKQRQPSTEQMELNGFSEAPDIKAVVAKTSYLVTQQTIDIPRILVVPEGEVKTGFNSFTLDLKGLNYSTISEDLWIQYLRTSQLEVLALGKGGIKEARLEDYVVSGLIDFDDISYDDHADLLYDLAGQVARHFQTTFSDDEIRKILRCHQQQIARFVHAQMQTHYWEEAVAYKVVVSKGFSELKESAYSYQVAEPLMDYGISPEDKSNMSRYLFGGFKRCLYRVQKFDSEAERKLASILERDALKWFKPAKGQFQIIYRHGAEQLEYIPDFVAETNDRVFMLEPKASNQMEDLVVLAKKEAAVKWCANASDYAKNHGVKTWRYVLIPHNEIAVNVTLDALAARFGV